MNLMLLQANEVDDGGRAILRGRRFEHLKEVLRSQEGDFVRVGILDAGVGVAEILRCRQDCVEIRVGKISPQHLPENELVLALPRPKSLRRILRTAASMAVARITLINAWKVDKAYWSSPLLRKEALAQEMLLGAEQGGWARVPHIEMERLFVPALAKLSARERPGYVLQPRTPSWLDQTPASRIGRVLAVGPEGGWTERELNSLVEAGFAAVCISDSILRSDVAVAAALAQSELVDRVSREEAP
jgi:RsmE family RNA methyltransferase